MKLKQSFVFLFALLLAGAAFGQNLNAIKQDMAKRQSQIEQLWKSGLIGENNKGYLEARGKLSSAQDKLVKDENADRKAVYGAIAKSTNTTTDKVGVQRARKISQLAVKGLWLQDAGGKWYKK